MKEEKNELIKCPNCGYEYLPAEIFYDLLGKPKNIVRTVNGNIDYYSGQRPSLRESYYCDHCGKLMSIECSLTFNVMIDHENDFDEDYETTIYSNRVTLEESDLFTEDD